MEDVREMRDFAVKHCRVVCFSGGGQYFSFASNAQVGTTTVLAWLLKGVIIGVSLEPLSEVTAGLAEAILIR